MHSNSRTAVLGEDHPDTLLSYFNLACVESLSGSYAASLAALRRAVADGKWRKYAWTDDDFEALRQDHPDEFLAVAGPRPEDEAADEMNK